MRPAEAHVPPVTGPRWRRAEPWLLAVVLAVAAAVRLWGITFGLPHTETRPDERQLVNLATRIADGDLNPHYFIWPTLQMYVLAVLYRVTSWLLDAPGAGELTVATRYLTSRLLTAALGTASVYLLWKAARRLGHGHTALAAAVFLALAFLHVRDSHFGMMDVPMTSGALLATVILVKPGPTDLRRLLLYGLVAGLATSVKYNAIFLICPAAFLVLREGAASRRVARPLAWTAALGAATCLGFLMGTPYALFDSTAFLAGTRALGEHIARGHAHEGQMLALTDAHRYYLTFVLPAALGWPVYLAGLAGLVLLAIRQPRGMAVVLFPLLYLAVAASGRTAFARYAIPVVPFLCLGAAETLRAIASRVNRTGIGIAVTAAIAMAMVLPSAFGVLWLDHLLTRRDSRLLGADWVHAHVVPGASIWQTGSIYARVQLSAGLYDEWTYDEAAGRFVSTGEVTADLPDVIIVQKSPLPMYSRVPPILESVSNRHFRLVHRITTGSADVPQTAYDPLDAFFLPLVPVHEIRRPGPDILVYERIAAE